MWQLLSIANLQQTACAIGEYTEDNNNIMLSFEDIIGPMLFTIESISYLLMTAYTIY